MEWNISKLDLHSVHFENNFPGENHSIQEYNDYKSRKDFAKISVENRFYKVCKPKAVKNALGAQFREKLLG